MEQEHQTAELENGVKIIYLQKTTGVSYCGFGIKTGTRDEGDDQHGMAHFVEHMLFKGTDRRKSHHIINRIEDVGGELNAFTSKEDTFVYGIVMEKETERCIELLSDILTHSNFPEREMEKEIDVVLDEINSYKDSPSELIYDDFEDFIFKNNPLGFNILGRGDEVASFNAEKCKYFYNNFYRSDEVIFFFLGSTPFEKIKKWVARYTTDIRPGKAERNRTAPHFETGRRSLVEKETFQSHVIIGGPAFSHFDENRIELFLLNNILGGTGMNSRLNLSLRERKGLVYSVESALTPYSDCGIFTIYYGCDPKNQAKCEALVHKELQRLRNEKLTSSQFDKAKKQIIGQLGINNENNENTALGLGKSFMYHGKYETIDEVFQRIDNAKAEKLLEIANQIYDPERLFTLIYR